MKKIIKEYEMVPLGYAPVRFVPGCFAVECYPILIALFLLPYYYVESQVWRLTVFMVKEIEKVDRVRSKKSHNIP